MAFDLLEHAENYLTPELIKRAGVLVNETPEKTDRAMSCIVPTLLAGVLDSAASSAGTRQVMQMVTEGGFENKLHRVCFPPEVKQDVYELYHSVGREQISSLPSS